MYKLSLNTFSVFLLQLILLLVPQFFQCVSFLHLILFLVQKKINLLTWIMVSTSIYSHLPTMLLNHSHRRCWLDLQENQMNCFYVSYSTCIHHTWNHFYSFILSSSILNLVFFFFGWTSQSAFIAFKSSPCTHFNAFFCLQDTILSLIDLSIAVFDAFFAFTALSVIHSNSRIDLEESLVRFVFGVCIAKPTRGSSISFPCSVHCLFQVGFNTNFQGLSPCFIFKLKYVPGG